jgi:competence protein ComFC
MEIGTWIHSGLALLYPEVCQLCGAERATPASGYVGERCRRQVRFIQGPCCRRCGLPFEGEVSVPFECANCREMQLHFSSARSAVAARGPVLEAIHRYKYRQALWFEPFLAGLLIRQAGPRLAGQGWNWIVPVPLHGTREREREFNQAERLARRLGEAVRIPVMPQALRRRRPTHTQTLLTRQQRAANVHNAFAVRRGCHLSEQRIVLVDDVFTTGATTSACAEALRAAGAAEVCVWTVARGL